MANMIMNVSRTVCQLIHYFPGKLGLTIDLPWPGLKNKQSTPHFDIVGFQQPGGVIYFIVASTILYTILLQIIKSISPKASIKNLSVGYFFCALVTDLYRLCEYISVKPKVVVRRF